MCVAQCLLCSRCAVLLVMMVVILVVLPWSSRLFSKMQLLLMDTRVMELKNSVNWESGGGVGGPLSLAPEAQGEGDWQHRKGAQGETSWFSNLYI